MNDSKISQPSVNPVVHYAIQLLALGFLMVWCFKILEPFITLLVWGSVLAITLYPLHKRLSKKLRDRNAWSAVIITVLSLALLIAPAVWLLLATIDELREVGAAYRSGDLHIPPPSEDVKNWPMIGSTIYNYWSEGSKSISAAIINHQDQVKPVLFKFLALFRTTASGIVLFTLSIVVSGVLMAYGKSASSAVKKLLVKIAGSAGETMTDMAGLTVRNVAKGVLGVAVIQSILAGIGFVLAGIPFAGFWILICLILAIVQIGILPVSVGAIIYIWSAADGVTAIIFTIWMLFVGVIDNILKPIMLGKGAPAPMLVVFLGAIGGFIFSGFIGLFTGAIVLTLGYKLINGWLYPESIVVEEETG